MESFQSLTVSQRDQIMVEQQVFSIYKTFYDMPPSTQSFMLELQRENHVEYLTKGLKQLGPSFCVLDASRPWICYWILHSIALMGEFVDPELEDNTVDFLSRCQDPNGGYGGGPGQMPHLATTYAAVNSLVTLGGDKALSSINRENVYAFLRRMKDPSGAFRMHEDGEIDVRACYTAISVASLLNILDDDLVQNVGNFIISCQTYEGGIAGEPGSEAHGGYTFCGLATMILINEVDRLDLSSLIDWVVFRQGVEGGFQGRTNKLVDGCYSFWQGGVFALLKRLHSSKGEISIPLDDGDDSSTESLHSSKGEISIPLDDGEDSSTESLHSSKGEISIPLDDGEDSSTESLHSSKGEISIPLDDGEDSSTESLHLSKGEISIPLDDGEDSSTESLQTTESLDETGEGLNKDLPQGGRHSEQGGSSTELLQTTESLDGTGEGLNKDLPQGGRHSEQRDEHDTSCHVNIDNIDHGSSSRHTKVEPLFNSLALQQYILLCSQEPGGGLRDKPGKSRDHYHTCYCLSGLSVCQHSWSEEEDSPPLPRAVLGPYSNLLEPIHPLYNVVLDRYQEAHEFFTRS